MAALQRELPDFTLRHASDTYTAPVKDWSGLVWSHRRSDDALVTRLNIDTITTTLAIGHQAPTNAARLYTWAVFENLPATIRRSKVATSLREMSGTLGKLTGSRSPSILHPRESLWLLSTAREGGSAGESSVSLEGLQTRPSAARSAARPGSSDPRTVGSWAASRCCRRRGCKGCGEAICPQAS